MENQEKGIIYEIIRSVKSWIPWLSKRSNVSRAFWMPDHTCGVCYDCDVEFNLFIRRHHCRLCGRIFCYKCIKNSVLGHVSFYQTLTFIQEGETTKLCNFCIKQCNEENIRIETCQTTSLPQNEFQISSSSLTPSSMTASLVSTKSTCSSNSRDTIGIGCPLQYSTRSPHTWSSSRGSDHNLGHAIISIEPDDQDSSTTSTNIMHLLSDIDISSPNQFDYCMNRSDDAIECNADYHVPEVQYYDNQSNGSYNSDDYDDVDNDTCLHVSTSSDESIDRRSSISSFNENPAYQTSINAEKIVKVETDNVSDCNVTSEDGTDSELVDFENNGMLWIPPSPANAADKEVASIDEEDDDDGDVAAGEFAYAQSPISYDSGESQNKNQTSEEHKIAMKDVVVGHFKALVSQLLQVEDLPIGEEDDKDGWLDIITSLSWEVATIFKPDTSNGGGMDIGGYAKIKCLASGHRSGSLVVSGIVCRKNLAHRRMKSKREKPCLLLLGGALEYHRVSNHLSTFDNLLQKEKDHLKMAVGMIDAHHVNVLLVEKTVSRFAQEYLLSKDISLVLNVKRHLLERISNCIDAPIVPSIDHLLSQNLGTCDLFHVDKFYEELNNTGRNQKSLMKNLMFFEGCPKPLGCTVLLMGASSGELKKVKHVLQYGIFAAYQLTLETSFLADEGAAIPEFPTSSPITVVLPEKPAGFGSSISTIPGFAISTLENTSVVNRVPSGNKILTSTSDSMSHSITKTEMPLPSHTSYQVHDSQSMENSSGFVYSFNDTKEPIENDFHAMKDFDLQPSGCFSPPSFRKGSDCGDISINSYFKDIGNIDKKIEKSLWKTSDHMNGFAVPVSCDNHFETTDAIPQIAEKKTTGNFFGPDFGNYFEDNGYVQEQELSHRDAIPAPSDHQSILVSLSTRCVWKGTVCERAHLFRIKYYGSFDKPLGRFLRDHLFDQYYQCHTCEMPSEAHVHCYTHRQGGLAISVKKISEVLAGEQDGKIWMWHSCLRCPREDGKPPRTLRVVMSDAAWGLSFGKFLELSFSNHAAASRVASCGHSLHRDCLRFYGFGQMVACFRYVSIDIHSVYLPPTQLDFSTKIQDWIRQEVNEVIDKEEILFTEVLKSINQISEVQININSAENNLEVSESEHYLIFLERMLHEEKAEFEECLSNVLKKEVKEGHRFIDVFDINKLQRRLLFHSYLWDQRLIFATGLAVNSRGRLSSMEKLVKSFTSQSAGFSTVNSLSSVTRNDSHHPSYEPRDLCSQQSQQNLVYRNSLADQDYNKYRIDVRSCHANTSSPHHQVNQSRGTVHRSLSDGHVSQLSDTLETKWVGENANTLTESEELEENVGLDRDRSMVASETPKDADIAVKYFSKWSGMSFLTAYQFIFMNVGFITPFLNIIFEYVPVHVSRFWELGDVRGDRLMFPIGINDTDIPIFDDEPSSIISYALITEEYNEKLAIQRDRPKDICHSCTSSPLHELGKFHLFSFTEDSSQDNLRSTISIDDTLLPRTMSSLDSDQRFFSKAENIRVSFTYDGPLGKVIYTVTCYHAVHFDVLRKTCCPSELDYIRSLSRCKKWRAQGGKSNVFFAKSLDDRFIIKQVTKTELDSFLQFSTKYFKYLCHSIGSRSPTCLAKNLGIYQVMTKHLKSGKEIKMDLLVMENLLYRRNITRLYDLKGSSRSRYNADKTGSNKVLLDQNLIEAMPTSPIFVGNKAKRSLERAVWNDTAFLASVDVMDYSLLVGVDGQSHELVLGIIDFMRQYTWDKHLETWVKTTGFLGGPKNTPPTVISPNQYKKRFRKAMSAYFVMVPDLLPCPSSIKPSTSHSDFEEDNIQGFSSKT